MISTETIDFVKYFTASNNDKFKNLNISTLTDMVYKYYNKDKKNLSGVNIRYAIDILAHNLIYCKYVIAYNWHKGLTQFYKGKNSDNVILYTTDPDEAVKLNSEKEAYQLMSEMKFSHKFFAPVKI